MAQVTKDTIIMDAIKLDEGIADFFFEIGMHCLGCSAARGETIAQACAVHDADPDELIDRINAYLKDKE